MTSDPLILSLELTEYISITLIPEGTEDDRHRDFSFFIDFYIYHSFLLDLDLEP